MLVRFTLNRAEIDVALRSYVEEHFDDAAHLTGPPEIAFESTATVTTVNIEYSPRAPEKTNVSS